MVKRLQFIFLLGSISVISFAQAPLIEWQKSLGGSGDEGAFSLEQTSDLGFIVTGSSDSNDGDVSGNHGLSDYWVIKLDANHNITWQKSLGGSGYDYCSWVTQTSDGGYVVTGHSSSNDGDVTASHGNKDIWVVKLSAGGAIQWQKSLGGSNDEHSYCIQQTSDGGYIISGNTYSNDIDVSGNQGGGDCWIVKLYSGGTIEWQKTLGGSGFEGAYFIQQTNDGGYIVAASTYSNDGDVTNNHGDRDYWLVKLNSTGNIQWQKTYGGAGGDYLWSVSQTWDGGYILNGDSDLNDGDVTGNHGNIDTWIVKVDSTGTLEWQKSFGGTGADYTPYITQTADSGYIVSGLTQSNNGDVSGNHGLQDSWVIKIDGLGALQWQKCLGGTLNETASGIIQTNDGGYVTVGSSRSNDGDVTGNHGNSDCWVVKLAAPIGFEEFQPLFLINVFPNPATSELRIKNEKLRIEKAEIYDVSGRLVYDEEIGVGGEKEIVIDVSKWDLGVYFVKVLSKEGFMTAKFVKE